MNAVGHHVVAGAEIAQVDDQRAGPVRISLHDRVVLADLRASPRHSEPARRGERQRALAPASQEHERAPMVGREGIAVPAGEADIVDADVQAAEFVAGVRRGGAGG